MILLALAGNNNFKEKDSLRMQPPRTRQISTAVWPPQQLASHSEVARGLARMQEQRILRRIGNDWYRGQGSDHVRAELFIL